MPKYEQYPGIDEGYNFPPEVRQSIAASSEIRATVSNSVGELVPDEVAEAISKDPAIRQAAINAIGPALAGVNIVKAYPETAVTRSGLREVPMQWIYKTLNDPYVDSYQMDYEGVWSGTTPREGRVPLLDAEGMMRETQIPGNYVTKENLLQLLPQPIDYKPGIESLGVKIDVVNNRFKKVSEKQIDSKFPILAARLAIAKANDQPAAFCYAGSSTSSIRPGYITALTSELQNSYVVEDPTDAQFSPTAVFSKNITPGLHGYSAALSGSNSQTYLTQDKCDKLALLDLAGMSHMVGSNDFAQKMSISTYKSNLISWLDYLDSKFTNPCQHILIHAYERYGVTSPAAPWSAYGEALKEISESRSNAVFVDLSECYEPNGVPGPDPLTLISSDRVHQTPDGYAFMSEILSSIYLK